jgi:asparagine synthase (glutamine-hydrolysing)
MCGIVALWDAGARPDERRAWAQRLSRRLTHRGPDGEGLWTDESIPLVLAHRRLAIRGLGEQGAQPMLGSRSVLVFNGELFGAEDLRHELAGRGLRFRGTSDTEILLGALEAFGIEAALARIRGQFAFAWWSVEERRLHLARDRVGIRPIYFAEQGQRLAVASEQKALLALPWVDSTASLDAMLRFLVLGRTDDVPGETLLAGIRSLPAGHRAVWDGRELRITRYDRIDTEVPESGPAEIRQELERAVEEQLVSDVPIGATVSGGLDSSTVALLADRARIRRGESSVLHLFAYHDRAAEQDESDYQRAVLAAMKSPHEVHWVSSSPAELCARFDRYVHHQEEPYGDVSSYAEYCLAEEAARSGVKVLLSGLGGDEVFVGYPSFFGPLLLDILRSRDLRALQETIRVAPEVLARSGTGWFPVVAALYHAAPGRLRNAISAYRSARAGGIRGSLAGRSARDAWSCWHVHDGRGPLNAALRGSIESWCIPRYLLHSDRMGLAHGVEGRVPLLDDGVIRAAFGVPPAARVGRTGLKASLRAAVGDVLPPLVRDRAWKLGFHAPVPVYVAALEEPLRAGHAAARAVLSGGPDWGALPPADRWRWGVLGSYLVWARGQRAIAPGRSMNSAIGISSG